MDMEWEDAIKCFESVIKNYTLHNKPVPEYVWIAIKALDKQIPKPCKIKEFEEDGMKRFDRHCSRCDSYLGGYMVYYCNSCGQAIDWSGVE